ncbi:hypothetical protein [Novosphingobium sp.]|uniref:hypothetical protein n=1 Tax=Novosphingobium sp. TaxID=1874826 RepID=UPI001D6A5152|nr:hypothetical protein [Novosphingobium sp.]MBX9663577.1 hypothetical protein [Novosphingobium sp.]
MMHKNLRPHAAVVAAVLGGLLSGCSTLGTNVSANFRCNAPDGLCAPSSVIDDSALARIEETSSTDLLNPAGPFRMDDGIDAPVHDTHLASTAPVARSAPRYQLSVVFPGFTDASGTAHARRVVSTEALLPGRGDAMEQIARRGSKPARSRGLLAAAESAPPVLAVLPEGREAKADPGKGAVETEVAAADAENPIAQIQAEVAQQLSAKGSRARSKPAAFSGVVE